MGCPRSRRGESYCISPGNLRFRVNLYIAKFSHHLMVSKNKIKTKALDGLQIELEPTPGSSSAGPSRRVGQLSRKHATYDIWDVHPDPEATGESQNAPVGGDEVLGLQCMLPRKKDGKLYLG